MFKQNIKIINLQKKGHEFQLGNVKFCSQYQFTFILLWFQFLNYNCNYNNLGFKYLVRLIKF